MAAQVHPLVLRWGRGAHLGRLNTGRRTLQKTLHSAKLNAFWLSFLQGRVSLIFV